MLLTVLTTHTPATDLCNLLHKNHANASTRRRHAAKRSGFSQWPTRTAARLRYTLRRTPSICDSKPGRLGRLKVGVAENKPFATLIPEIHLNAGVSAFTLVVGDNALAKLLMGDALTHGNA